MTVKFAGTLVRPLTVSVSGNRPSVEPQFPGSFGPMLFALHVAGKVLPLHVTKLLPWVEPKLRPLIVKLPP